MLFGTVEQRQASGIGKERDIDAIRTVLCVCASSRIACLVYSIRVYKYVCICNASINVKVMFALVQLTKRDQREQIRVTESNRIREREEEEIGEEKRRRLHEKQIDSCWSNEKIGHKPIKSI